VPLIEGGRWDGIARKLFNIAAPQSVPNLADEILPTFEIQNWEPELYALRKERLLVGAADAGPVSAQFSHVAITNPNNSRTLVIVEDYMGFSPNAGDVFLGIENEELTTSLGWTLIQYGNRDFRWPGQAVISTVRSVARLVNLNAAVAQGTTVQSWPVSGILSGPIAKRPFVLPPNTGLIMRRDLVAQRVRGTFFWRERPFNPQETPG